MTDHLSDAQFEDYRLRRAGAPEMAAMTAHLAECAQCRDTLLRRRTSALLSGLWNEPPSHLTYTELEHYVDGNADDVDREIVESHLEGCADCREQLRVLHQAAEVSAMDLAAPTLLPPDLDRGDRPQFSRASGISAAYAPGAAMPSPAQAPRQAAPMPAIPPVAAPKPPRRKLPVVVAALLLIALAILLWILSRR